MLLFGKIIDLNVFRVYDGFKPIDLVLKDLHSLILSFKSH